MPGAEASEYEFAHIQGGRIGEPGLFEALAQCHASAFEGLSASPLTAKSWSDLLKFENRWLFLASQVDEIAAFLLFQVIPPEAEIITIGVHPDHRNKSLGQMLLCQGKNRLSKQSIKKFHLEVDENNETAVSFYLKNDFQLVGRRKGYYSVSDGESRDALLYCLDLFCPR